MNRVLGEVNALPLYGQVTIEDPGTADLPEGETGGERVVSTAYAIAVATRPDLDGEVNIVVMDGSEIEGLGTLVFDGELILTSPSLDVGNSVAATVERIHVGRTGALHIWVFVDPSDRPSSVKDLVDRSANEGT